LASNNTLLFPRKTYLSLTGQAPATMYKKDYLLKQLDDFFEAIARITGKLQHNDLTGAEHEITQDLSEDRIENLLTAENLPAPDYDYLKFQAELLVLKWKLVQKKNLDTPDLQAKTVTTLQKLIHSRPDQYDVRLHELLAEITDAATRLTTL